MKYRNAAQILPDDLLKELQKYAEGQAIYVPKRSHRKKWGQNTGTRTFFLQRNEEIRNKYRHNISIEELADEYSLSYETIRNILYR